MRSLPDYSHLTDDEITHLAEERSELMDCSEAAAELEADTPYLDKDCHSAFCHRTPHPLPSRPAVKITYDVRHYEAHVLTTYCSSLSNDESSSCFSLANGLATVTPLQVNPACRSSDSRRRQPAAAAADRTTESQMLRRY